MEEWLIIVITLAALLLFVVAIPLLFGVLYRACTRKCTSQARLDGKTVIVTGATSGIGKETALFLAGRGCRLIIACRTERKGQGVADEIISKTGNSNVVVRVVDLADFDSVRSFAAKINAEEQDLHVLVNNAGVVVNGARQTSPQGFELTLATNHYGGFLLTNLLMIKLQSSAPSRIVTVSSKAQMANVLDVDDLNFERHGYTGIKAYCQSKLCNVLFTKELARRLQGTGVTANCLHPGFVSTGIFAGDRSLFARLTSSLANVVGRTAVEGAQTTIYLALSEDVEGVSGYYYYNCRKTKLYRKAMDMELARKLWDVSCRDVNLAPELDVARHQNKT